MRGTMSNEIIDDGGPAFPASFDIMLDPDACTGMTMRDWFAGMALQGLLAHPEIGNTVKDDRVAMYAWRQADAMLKTREQAL